MLRRLIIWGAAIACCAWLAASVYLGEISLRLPRKPVSPPARWDVVAPESVEIVSADGLKLGGWFFPAPARHPDTVILVHGQTDNRAGMLGFANFFLRHGYSVLTPDMRGHGASDGELTTYGLREAGDIARWIDWSLARQPGSRVFGLGESMGAAILLQALGVDSRLCAVVAEAPYATFRDIAFDRLSQQYRATVLRHALRPVLELSILYQRARYGVDLGRVSPKEAVAHSRTPVLLIHGARDENTPAQHARSIHQANPANVTSWEVPGAGHTGAWGSRPREFERRVLGWFGPAACP